MRYEHQIYTYMKKLSELLPEHEGRFALVHRDEVTVFDTLEEANAAGYAKTGMTSGFLVMRITPIPSKDKP